MAFGGEIILRPRSWRRLLRFASFATIAALSPSTYGPAARAIAVRQIYLTAWTVLPGYLAFSALLSLVLIEIVHSTAHAYGLSQHALELVLRVLVLELIPLLTALFVALRSGAAIGAEIALMRVSGELEEHADAGAGPLQGELVPRIAGAALSVFSLTILSSALALYLAYALFYGTSSSGFVVFTRVVGHVFDIPILAGLMLKCLLFGLAVALIPLATGLEAERGEVRTVPAAVLAGLMKLFLVIGLIEVLSLMIKYV
ncbi:MAG: ABC transporter permease [Betaproteobacteria bacterium]|nr:ABC transporter permease [Betaproteobacteria bacterium]